MKMKICMQLSRLMHMGMLATVRAVMVVKRVTLPALYYRQS